ncbi:hypothetical protein R1CP_20035 [Rhodococcus opacus]|uniref:Uncharacterized protein n=1 Tax=Rhodococcus opacus TaxID=37919 RepID=A0A1B1K7Z0_RHOOP|nr:hypothetical protein [Rhodococcus opacus]ANS28689.1 hypothetical protein R1CP_20035 [Rhodococcus opacus]
MRRRWPAAPPPPESGASVHRRAVLAADLGITVELTDLLLYPDGVELCLALTAYGHAARQARFETRHLTDPHDPCAQWSFLRTEVRYGNLHGEADPYQAPILSFGTTRLTNFRTTPRYWIGGGAPTPASLTVTVDWTRIGLAPTTSTVDVGPVSHVLP